jgi:hypothetical protein
MKEAVWNAFLGAFEVLPSTLDRLVKASGPAANAIGGETQLFYFAVAILTAQLWRIVVALSAAAGQCGVVD